MIGTEHQVKNKTIKYGNTELDKILQMISSNPLFYRVGKAVDNFHKLAKFL